MTEDEFNRRLIAVIRARPQSGVDGLAGIADIFNSVKNTIVSVGSKLMSGIKVVGTTLASGARSIFTAAPGAVGSSTGQTLLEAAGTIYATKTQADIIKAQNKAAADSNSAQMAYALAAQGIDVNTPQGKKLLQDVANGGIVNTNGQVLFPAANPGERNASLFGLDMQTIKPILIAAGALMALSFVSQPRSGRRAKH